MKMHQNSSSPLLETRPWHSCGHTLVRQAIVEEIEGILKNRRTDAPQQWIQKVPELARKFDDYLYYSAASLEEYSEINTLKDRLQTFAKYMMHAYNEAEARKREHTIHGIPMEEVNHRQQQHRLLLLRHAALCVHEKGRCPHTAHCWNMKLLLQHTVNCSDSTCNVMYCAVAKNLLTHHHSCSDDQCPVCEPVKEAVLQHHDPIAAGSNTRSSNADVSCKGYHDHTKNHVAPHHVTDFSTRTML